MIHVTHPARPPRWHSAHAGRPRARILACLRPSVLVSAAMALAASRTARRKSAAP